MTLPALQAAAAAVKVLLRWSQQSDAPTGGKLLEADLITEFALYAVALLRGVIFIQATLGRAEREAMSWVRCLRRTCASSAGLIEWRPM